TPAACSVGHNDNAGAALPVELAVAAEAGAVRTTVVDAIPRARRVDGPTQPVIGRSRALLAAASDGLAAFGPGGAGQHRGDGLLAKGVRDRKILFEYLHEERAVFGCGAVQRVGRVGVPVERTIGIDPAFRVVAGRRQ